MEESVSASTPQPLTTFLPQVTKTDVANNSAGAIVVAEPVTTPASGGQGIFDLLGKKKRGRPRKYDSDGNLTKSYQNQSGSAFSFSSKKARPKPLPHLFASFGGFFADTAGGDFTPHVVTVHTGEDVAGKILSFAQNGPRGICILSANGAISNVSMRQPGSSGGLLTYEGRFEILSLSGSFTMNDNGSGMTSRTGGLSVSLAGPDGRVIGGGVAGLLTAASPIQIVMGSFMSNGCYHKKHKKKQHRQHTAASPISGGPDAGMAARPVSHENPNGEACLKPTSQIPEQGPTEFEDVTRHKQNSDTAPNEHLNGSQHLSDQRSYPDINISLPAR
ncbi:AT-hook motif nuclear-localized protein 1-like [Neltuma alba]|uniref:AT-hook motif nuclear-localized protein 1-like n=1 Tax=Neltuma alba TaxID=207710 RepID=UPI0010A4DD2C|nr:AT-hook motif nuclear-localized protein 1-like [Prosopis alba]XP_028789359.1 AT-hook motif nuclear-localized protein 1-like [Prosopis alba]